MVPTVALLLAIAAPPETAPAPRLKLDSPRLTALAADLAAGKSADLDAFWTEVTRKAPLVEPVAGDGAYRLVTFVFRGDAKTGSVGLLGGIPSNEDIKPLDRLAGTDLWFRTERMPGDSRFVYAFVADQPTGRPLTVSETDALVRRARPDPLNPNRAEIGSAVELPDARPMPWVKPVAGVPKGAVKPVKVPSARLGKERAVTVYTPPGYDPAGDPVGLLVVFDGLLYQTYGAVPTTLDNLTAQKTLPPLVTVFVAHADRVKELSCSEPFADFVATELVPWVRANYRVSADPARTAVAGFSLGGLMAAFCGHRHPEVFGNVLSKSGSFWWHPAAALGARPQAADPFGWLTREFVRADRRPVRFFLAVGTMEAGFPINMVIENRRFRDVLEAKGYAVTYTERHSDHTMLGCRGSFADGLIALFGR